MDVFWNWCLSVGLNGKMLLSVSCHGIRSWQFPALLAQMRRIMDLNTATEVTLEVVEAARDRLVIGPG